MNQKINTCVVGATGYVGLELVKILSKHPNVRIIYLCAQSSIGKKISFFNKKIIDKKLPRISSIKKIDWKKIDLLFTALPNGEAQSISKKINKKIKLIDLSADFRLKDINHYKKWYKINHKSQTLLKKSIYGLSEFKKNKLKNAKLISCPGCYPTSILIPLLPLVKDKLINLNNIRIDSKSGYSGAGKKINKRFEKDLILESVSAYGIGYHRHMAEIDQEISHLCKKKINVFFTPHLLPMFRGILSTIYIDLPKGISAKRIYNHLLNAHRNNFFVKIKKFNSPLGTNEVINTNFCKISVCLDRSPNKLIIISVIDNLMKGASGQAVQNMNLSYGFSEKTGLI